MSMGKREGERQKDLWVPTAKMPQAPGHPFYPRLSQLLASEGLLKGKTIGVDATTLEANAAMRSIVRKDTGEGYEELLEGLAKPSGIGTPTRQDLAKLDRGRKNKASNNDWESPSDPNARITRMKDGRTHLEAPHPPAAA